MQIHELKCFGAQPGAGNRALVIEGGPGDAAARQAFAVERNAPACVFLDASADPGTACVLDYYYPHARSPLCLHATLAAAWVLFNRAQSMVPISVRSVLRGQLLVLTRGPEGFYVSLQRQAVPAIAIPPGLAATLLARPGLVLVSAPVVASVGSPKLLLEVADVATLHALRPDLARIAEWSKEHGVSGCYAYCRTGGDRYEGRNFNHLNPALEDSATGVAAGALTALVGHGLTLVQGTVTGQPCLLRTRLSGTGILVGGAAAPA